MLMLLLKVQVVMITLLNLSRSCGDVACKSFCALHYSIHSSKTNCRSPFFSVRVDFFSPAFIAAVVSSSGCLFFQMKMIFLLAPWEYYDFDKKIRIKYSAHI